MLYSLAKKVLFRMPAERSHDFSMHCLAAAGRLRITKLLRRGVIRQPVHVMGLTFPNCVGVAAGLDKNGDVIDGLGDLGFGFLEFGSVTPRPQFGNARPRVFRLVDEKAVINRLGFNNKGVHYLVDRLRNRRYKGIVGVNIGKNKETPNDHAVDDYSYCFKIARSVADYITVNLSSPNTPNLRDLQTPEALHILLEPLKHQQAVAQSETGRYIPIVVKLAPDLNEDQIGALCETLVELEVDGLIGTNTTISREGVPKSWNDEMGGLSGAPLTDKACSVLRQMSVAVDGKIPLIGVGGIMNPDDAVDRLKAGASLIQLYSGMIYYGPRLVIDCLERIKSVAASN